MNAFETKQAARRERLLVRADRLNQEADRRLTRAMQIGHSWPMGQPILVGHHSEKRHRRDIKRMDDNMRAGVVAQAAARHALGRAHGVGTGGVSSDDPDAVVKLREELAKRAARQAHMKAANVAARKGEAGAVRYADYSLSNNNANIRRIRERIALLERNAARESVERVSVAGFLIAENVEDNRLQLFFAGKPDAEVRAALKSHGFRWAPSVGAWQRQLSNSARYAVEYVERACMPATT